MPAKKKLDYSIIGAAIKMYRQKSGMSQDTLSEYADITVGYLSKIEKGQCHPSLDVLANIANALGITMNDLFYDFDISQKSIITRNIMLALEECSFKEQEYIYNMIRCLMDFLEKYGIRLH